ncbi:MAG: C40 family peptidase [Eubacterium sp.]|nr:C40 family peptidase [Eubacterium sp.]
MGEKNTGKYKMMGRNIFLAGLAFILMVPDIHVYAGESITEVKGENHLTEEMVPEEDYLKEEPVREEEHCVEEPVPIELIPWKTGWNQIDDDWYWVSDGDMPISGWRMIRGEWYCFRDDGRMITGWEEIEGKRYCFDADGRMCTGWREADGSWYYFTRWGFLGKGWLKRKSEWYYLGEDGMMTTGWEEIRGKWYFFDDDGKMLTGFLSRPEGDYFLTDSGEMAVNGWLVRDGHTYHFKSNGLMDRNDTEPKALVDMPGYYISPMYAGNLNTREERIEAMIRRAYDYKNAGTTYKICKSMAPGQYADCSGLVMQCLYAAGFDPAPATPKHHALPENEYDSRTLYNKVSMKHVSYRDIQRGDLVFYRSKQYSTIIHVAIYLGNGKVIESWPPRVTDRNGVASNPHPYILGVARPFE